MRIARLVPVLAILALLFVLDSQPASSDGEITASGPPVEMAEVITVDLDKPKATVRKTDGVKIQGEIGGLEPGKRYIVRVQVYEDGGTAYSAPKFLSFEVEG
ncbi:hypothetical protein ACFL3Z_02825 [Gemmatimonadota bacterium]